MYNAKGNAEKDNVETFYTRNGRAKFNGCWSIVDRWKAGSGRSGDLGGPAMTCKLDVSTRWLRQFHDTDGTRTLDNNLLHFSFFNTKPIGLDCLRRTSPKSPRKEQISKTHSVHVTSYWEKYISGLKVWEIDNVFLNIVKLRKTHCTVDFLSSLTDWVSCGNLLTNFVSTGT